MEVDIKGLVIAGTQSGCGKTTLSLGLMAALAKRGLRVAPFKVGPDFIDPGHHQQVTGRVSRNLDGWMLGKESNRLIFARGMQGCDIAVVEGVMGLFDGYDGRSEAGSTAQMGKWLDLPVILVVDARSMARSAAAVVQGFENFDPQLTYAGVLFNRIGSRRHLQYLQEALNGHVGIPCLGGIERDEAVEIPERHLGLVTQQDHAISADAIDRLAATIEAAVSLDRLLERIPEIRPEPLPDAPAERPAGRRVRIGVARDRAFCFYYQDNLDLLADWGAELVEFSPIGDHDLPPDLAGIYLGGGYPELFAGGLEANRSMRVQLRAAGRAGMPIYAECGGLMYLGRDIEDWQGRRFTMTGCLPIATRMLPRRRSLGYRQVTLARQTVLGDVGEVMRGHEFHYSELTGPSEPIDRAYRIADRDGQGEALEGYVAGNTLGSYVHLHFGSRPAAAEHFVAHCRTYMETQEKRL